MYVHEVTNSHFCRYMEMIFMRFETHFQTFEFSGPMLLGQ